MPTLPRLQIVHPDPEVGVGLAGSLEHEGILARVGRTVREGLEGLETSGAEVLLCAASFEDGDWRTLLAETGRRWPQVPVLLLTAVSALGEEAVRAGADDFCPEDARGEQLLFHVRAALAHARHGSRGPGSGPSETPPVGVSPAFDRAVAALEAARADEEPVLLTGEEGTGRGRLLRLLHRSGDRARGPLLSVDAAVLPESFLELRLAGYAPHAFSGAAEGHPGRAELARGGLLHLHAPERLSRPLQARLLRLLTSGAMVRRGEDAPRPVDVRVAATSESHPDAYAGQLVDGLGERLQLHHVHLPPLRERPEDIPVLAEFFLGQVSAARGIERSLTPEALDLLGRQSWRGGNARRLRNFIERLVVLCDSPRLGVAEVERELTRASSFAALTARPTVRPEVLEVERRILLTTLERTGGDRAAAARVLDVPRRLLFERLATQGLLAE